MKDWYIAALVTVVCLINVPVQIGAGNHSEAFVWAAAFFGWLGFSVYRYEEQS